MIVIVFRTRIREGVVEQEMEELGNQMYKLASKMPGFISYKDFAAPDGEYVSIVEFESLGTLATWRDHPEHKEAQRLGRERYFSEYHIQVCTTVRDYRFPASE
ncbi:MAG: antibiotic biosynthesis monooxygenase [Gammaproteobacteria bacterium]|nr:antibiotic biosynthesis monooxygenase [Gammaproteobacteria bacterium]